MDTRTKIAFYYYKKNLYLYRLEFFNLTVKPDGSCLNPSNCTYDPKQSPFDNDLEKCCANCRALAEWNHRSFCYRYVAEHPNDDKTLPLPEGRHEKNVPYAIVLTDFIYDPDGEIVYPFNFWRDCIDVYSLKHRKGYTNGNIARNHIFKSSNSIDDRARLQLVANMLIETNKILDAISNNQFPPMTLSAGKQPTMIF